MIDRSFIKRCLLTSKPFEKDLKDLMKPLETMGITDIAYCQRVRGFRKTMFCTNSEFQQLYLAKVNDYLESSFIENDTNVNNSPIITSDTDVYEENDLDVSFDMAKHGLGQWVILQNYDPEKNTREFFWFYAKEKKAHIVEEIASRSYELNLFSLYLKDRAKKLLIEASVPDAKIPNVKLPPKQDNTKELLSFDIEHYHLGYPFQTHLTKQEISCLKLFFIGFSGKEIAKELSLSPRTVEAYLNTARGKLIPSKKNWRQQLMECQSFMRLCNK